MNTTLSRPKITVRRIGPITGNRHKSLYDPRTIDEIRHALDLLLDLRVVIVDQSNPRKNVLLLSDSRAVLPLAIPAAKPVVFSKLYVIEHKDEYLSCVTKSQLEQGQLDKPVKVAKPMCMRTSRVQEVLPDGTTNTYSAWNASQQSRHADGDDGTSEDQFITPRYLMAPDNPTDVGEDSTFFILATNIDTFAKDEDGKAIQLVDMNVEGRAYAAPQ